MKPDERYSFTIESEDGVRTYSGSYIPPWDASDYALRIMNQFSGSVDENTLSSLDASSMASFFVKGVMSFDRGELKSIIDYLVKNTVLYAKDIDVTSEAIMLKDHNAINKFFAKCPKDYFQFIAHIIYKNLSPFLPTLSTLNEMKGMFQGPDHQDKASE